MNQFELHDSLNEIDEENREHMLGNIKYSGKTLSDLPTSKNVACIVAGPSLDERWDEIREFEGLKVCCSRALICCQEAGVMPDIVVNMDSSDPITHYWDDVKAPYLSEPVYLASPNTPTKTLERWNGDVAFMHPTCWHEDALPPGWNGKPDRLYWGSHIGGFIASFALNIGATPHLFGYDYNFRGAKVMDPKWGELVVCFQYYASPMTRTFLGYKSANMGNQLRCHDARYILSSYPKEDPENPGFFTTDNMILNRRRLINTFWYYGKEAPCLKTTTS